MIRTSRNINSAMTSICSILSGGNKQVAYSTAEFGAKTTGFRAKWIFLTCTTAYGVYSYYNFMDAKKMQSIYDISPYKLALYRFIPLNSMTSVVGKLSNLTVPSPLRGPLYGFYSYLFGCNLDECAPLSTYPTFNSFFSRTLFPRCRPLSDSLVISPADARVLSYGKLEPDQLYPDQIKGVRYPLEKLLRESNRITSSPDSSLYYCTLYLSPGSYHRFHCPVEGFKLRTNASVEGEALPVAPWALRWVPGLFTLNERRILSGNWKYGNMYVVPVGAANVKSIKVNPENVRVGNTIGKGQELGHFELGSTVVLVFEGPKSMQWSVNVNDCLKYGQSLADARSWSCSWPIIRHLSW